MLSSEQILELLSEPMDAVNRVRRAREKLKLLQFDVCARTRLSQSYLSAIERGDYSELPLETSRTLAQFFGCAIEFLFPPVDVADRDQPALPFARRKAVGAR
jgi:transcriptional regulator with XRE-family HTH domain